MGFPPPPSGFELDPEPPEGFTVNDEDSGVLAGLKRSVRNYGVPTSLEEIKAIPEQVGRGLLSYPVPYLPIYEAITKGPTRAGRGAAAQAVLGPAGAPQFEQAEQAVEAPTALEATGHAIAAGIPFFGPQIGSVVHAASKGDYAGAATEAVTDVALAALLHRISKGKASEAESAKIPEVGESIPKPPEGFRINEEAPAAESAAPTQPEAPAEPVATKTVVPERTLGETELDKIPEPLKVQAREFSEKLAQGMADTGKMDEGMFSGIPDELRPHAQDIRSDAVHRAAAILDAREFLKGMNENHGATEDGVRIVKSSDPESFDILQSKDGKVVGAAAVRSNGLRMIAGGRKMGSPVSISPVYELLDNLGVERDDLLSPYGAESRRNFAAKQAAGSQQPRGAPVSEGAERVPPGATGGAPEAGESLSPDINDPYIYGNLDPTKPNASSKRAVRLLLRPFRPVLTNIERINARVGPAIAEGGRRMEQMWERRASSRWEQLQRLNTDMEAAGFKWDKFDEWRRDPASVPPKAKALFDRFVAIDDKIGKDAISSGAMRPEDWVEGHYPEVAKDQAQFSMEARVERLAKQRGISIEEAAAEIRGDKDVGMRVSGASPFNSHLQIRREGGLKPGEYHTDFQNYLKYAVDAEGRIADAATFGAKGEKLQRLINQIPNEADRRYVMTHMDRLRRVTADPTFKFEDKVLGEVRGATSFGSLGLGAISQAGQTAAPIGHAGVMRTAGALLGRLAKPNTVKGLGRIAQNFREMKLDASQSLFPSMAQEYASGVGLQGFFGKAPHLKALGRADALMRQVSDPIGKAWIAELAKRAKAGDKSAGEFMRRMYRLDYTKFDPTNPEHMKIAGKAFADSTQLRTGISNTPGWASHPYGKTISQFSNIVFQQTRHIADLGRLAAQGNKYAIKALARGAVAGALVGNYVVGPIKDAIKGYGFQAEDPDGWEDALKRFSKGRRIPLTGKAAAEAPVKNTALWAAQGLMLAGTLGFMENIIRGVTDSQGRGTKKSAGEVAFNAMAGPTAEKVTDIVVKPLMDASKGEPGKALVDAGEGIIRGYVPIFGRELARELSSKELPDRPGWAGRIRDVYEGAQDPLEALTGGFVTGQKAERREAQSQRKASAEEIRALNEQVTDIAPHLKRSQEERDALQAKRLAKLKFTAPLVEALKANDREAMEAILREAASQGIRFTAREVRGLMGRVNSSAEAQ